MAALRNQLLILGATALVVAGLVGWIVARQGLRPLSIIAAKAADVATARDFSRRLGQQGINDEVGRLSRTIDQLLATVEDTLKTHRDFVADTSHELRNPLLAIRTNLDLVSRVATREERQECVQEARQEVERMSRLVSDLLILAQVEARLVVERQPVQLVDVVSQVVREAEQQARGQRLRITRSDPVQVVGDAGRLVQVLRNLLDNALRYTPPEGEIRVSLRHEGDGGILTVEDTGEGIRPQDLGRVFERSFRRRPAGGASSESYGLGLTIVKHLVEAHGGTVEVSSVLGAGSRFTVWLPTAERPDSDAGERHSAEQTGQDHTSIIGRPAHA
jgi:two-component system sensor histidine kinase MprB